MSTFIVFKFLLLIVSAFQVCEGGCSQEYRYSKPDRSEGWCESPRRTQRLTDPRLETQVDNKKIVGVAIVPDPDNSKSGFLKGFTVSYTNDSSRGKWLYLKEWSGIGSLYAIKRFKGVSKDEAKARSDSPYYRLFMESIDPLYIRIHVLVQYPLNAPCMKPELQIPSQCVGIPALPEVAPLPSCGKGHHLQFGYCTKKVFCPPGWILYEEQSECYFFDGSFQFLTFSVARDRCHPHSLLVLTKPRETVAWISGKLKEFATEMASSETQFWIGLYAMKDSNGYTWLWLQDKHSTEPIKTLDTSFLPAVRGSSSTRTCVLLQSSGVLTASGCSSADTFICFTPKATDPVCPVGWVVGSTGCYYFSPPELKGSWQHARYMCESMDSTLLSITRQTAWAWIKEQVDKTKERVQSVTGSNQFWVGAKANYLRRLQWITSSTDFSSVYFLIKKPDMDYWGCASMKPDKTGGIQLYDNSCVHTVLPFVCETTGDDFPVQGSGRLEYVKAAYLYPEEAQGHCLKLGGNLISFHTDNEFTQVTNNLKLEGDNLWIYGLKSVGLGEYKYWIDDTEVDFTAWADNQPSFDKLGQHYVYGNQEEQFSWEVGDSQMKPFICKLQKHVARRLLSGNYAIADTSLQSNQYVNAGYHATYFSNSAVNSRIGSERFFRINDKEEFIGRDGYKPSITQPMSANQPFIQASFEELMVVEALIMKNLPYETYQSGSVIYYSVEYSHQNDMVSYSESAGFSHKQIFEYPVDYDYELLIEFKVPIITSVISLSLVSSNADVKHNIQWDVIGYPADESNPVDLCLLVEHGCSHHCVLTLTSYRCYCPNNYHLFADGKNCIPDLQCHGKYKKIGDNCYKVYNKRKSYDKAQAQCREDGATLASIHSRTQMELIRRELKQSRNYGSKCILGLRGSNLLMGRWDDKTWIDVEYFGVSPPENTDKPWIVYIDQRLAFSWNSVEEKKSTKGGFICQQLIKDCHVPLLSSPVSVPTEFTASSQQSGSKASIELELTSFVHDPNTDESPVWLQYKFQKAYMITGLTYSAGDRLGVDQFTVLFSSDGVKFKSYKDKFGTEVQVFTFPSPPSSLTYVPVVPPVTATHVRISYNRPESNSQRIGVAFEVYGCPSESQGGSVSFCGSSSVGYKHLMTKLKRYEYHCLEQCSDKVRVDNSATCESSNCNPNLCQNEANCTAKLGGYDCQCVANFEGPKCETGKTTGLKILQTSYEADVNQVISLGLVFDFSPPEEKFVLDFGNKFEITVDSSRFSTMDNLLVKRFLNAFGESNHTGFMYLVTYAYITPGRYVLTLRTTVATTEIVITTTYNVSDVNPCFTSLTLKNIETSYMKRQSFMENMAISVRASVHTACEGQAIRSELWRWTVFRLAAATKTEVTLPNSVVVNEPSLLIHAETLTPGQYYLVVELILRIEPTLQELKAAAGGYIDIIEPTYGIYIMRGSKRVISTKYTYVLLEAKISSFRPEYDPTGHPISIAWYCYQYDPSESSDQCDIGVPMTGNQLTSESGYTLLLLGADFDSAVNYTFTVDMRIGSGVISYSQQISVTDDKPPDMSISCVINCGKEMNPGEKSSFKASTDIFDLGSLKLLWKLSPKSSLNQKRVLLWGIDTATLPGQDSLVIRPDVLIYGESYTITVEGTSQDGLMGYAEMDIYAAASLTGGQCEVTPGSGFTLTTDFTLSCHDFLSQATFLYKVYLLEPGSQGHKWSLLSEGYKSDVGLHFLPAGDPTEDYVQSLVVQVIHSSGVYVNVSTTVQVKSLEGDSKLSVLENLVLGDNSNLGALDKLVMLGGTEDSLLLLNSVVPELNTVSEDEGMQEIKKQMREKLMGTLTKVKQDTVAIMKQTSYMVDNLLKNKNEISSKIKDDADGILKNVTAGLKDLALLTTPKDTEEAAGFLVGGLSRLLTVVSSEAAGTSRETTDTLEKAQSLSSNVIEQLESVLDSVAVHMVNGEDRIRLASDSAILMVKKDYPHTLAGTHLIDKETGLGGVALPPPESMPAIEPAVKELSLKVVMTECNPFPGGNSEIDANQSSIVISMKHENGEVTFSNLSVPFDVFIPINRNESNLWSTSFKLKVPFRTETGEVYKDMIKPVPITLTNKPGYSTILKATADHDSVQMTTIIRLDAPVEGVEDVYTDQAQLVTLPKSEDELETWNSLTTNRNILYFPSNVSIFLSTGNWSRASSRNTAYYLAIIPKINQIVKPSELGWPSECVDKLCEFSMAYLNVTLDVLRAACLYWSEESSAWSTEGCVSTQFSTHDQIHCWCTHLSVFSASIFVVPNLVNPITDISLFLTFFDNPLVVCLVLAIWYLYFILLIWVRHKDKADEALTGVTVLGDNSTTNTYLYLVGVTTGWWRGAGTTAKVFLSLDGLENDSLRHGLHDDRRRRFAKGAEDWFLLATPQSLGELRSLSIWHNNGGSSPAWFLNDVVIQDVQTEQSWTFIYNNWLATDRGNLQVMVELPAISAQEMEQNKTQQFSKMSSRDMRDGHLWFSIFVKPLQSKFTRVQRLSCALVLLLTAMLTNLMFHGIPTDDPTDQVSGQGLVISLSSIVIGVETALIMFPINFVVIQLFLKLKPRAKKQIHLKTAHGEIKPLEIGAKSGRVKDDKKPSTPGILPWWFVYISWSLLLAVALVCSFFVMLYGLKYGYSRSVEWAVSFFTSFLTSALVTQPLKVVGLALILAVLLKGHVNTKYQTGKDEEFMETITKEKEYSAGDGINIAEPPSLSKKALKAIKDRVIMEWRMHDLWKELVLYFSFVAVVVIVAHGHRNVDTCYLATKSVEEMFIQGNYHGKMPFTKVSTVDNFWTYVEDVLLPTLYSTLQDTNFSSSYLPLTADRVSLAVGLPRIRQIRKESGNCLGLVRGLPPGLGVCKSLEAYTSEDSASYNGSWSGEALEKPPSTPDQWSYRSAWSLRTIPYMGRYASYSGGGYVVKIPATNSEMEAVVSLMKETAWVDERTLAMFIELSVYNPSTNLFSVIMMLFEFSGPGQILPYHQIFTCKMYHYGNDFESFVATCEVLFILFAVALTYYEVKRFRKLGRAEYFRDPWSYAEIMTAILSITTIALYIQRTMSVSSAIDEYKDSEGKSFVNFYTAAVWDFTLGYVLSFLVMLVILKVIKLFRFNKRMTIFGLTLRLAGESLFSFAVVAIIFFIAFAHFSLLVFGPTLETYKDFLSTLQTLYNFGIGVSDFFGLASASRIIGPVFFFVFVFFVQMLLMSLFLAIIMDAFTEARRRIDLEKNEYELVEFIWGYVLLTLGIRKKREAKSKKKKTKEANKEY